MDAPSSRYKIVERGRRLVTIDTLTGEEAGPPPSSGLAPPDAQARIAPSGPGNSSAEAQANSPRPQGRILPRADSAPKGSFMLSTEVWFDARAPRDLSISILGLGWQLVVRSRFLLVILVLLFLTASWLLFLLPLLLVPAVRRGLARLFRPFITRLLDQFDPAIDPAA